MPHHDILVRSGTITHVFFHRFVVETDGGAILADLTPKGVDRIALRVGDRVTLEGEMKPSELKVSRLTRGDTTIRIEHDKKHHHPPHHHAPADPDVALKAARKAGYEPVGEPHRKPKHFEVLGRRDDELTELHIELDGHIRKMKTVDAGDAKWAARV